jgi:stress-induced morphogen
MYEILISSVEFSGKRTVMQHRMVNEVNIKCIMLLNV